jgi:hypothetical protein
MLRRWNSRQHTSCRLNRPLCRRPRDKGEAGNANTLRQPCEAQQMTRIDKKPSRMRTHQRKRCSNTATLRVPRKSTRWGAHMWGPWRPPSLAMFVPGVQIQTATPSGAAFAQKFRVSNTRASFRTPRALEVLSGRTWHGTTMKVRLVHTVRLRFKLHTPQPSTIWLACSST